MENLTIEHITSFVEVHRYTAYFILFIAMVLEGEVFLIIAGMLANLEALDVGDVFWISLLGVVLGNVLWYYLGSVLKGKSFARQVIVWAEKAIAYFLPRFRERPFKSIFFSKFIYGTNRATVIMSGVLKVNFALFLRAEFLASILWVVLYLTIGYFFGYAAIHVTRNVSRFALLIIVFVVAFMLLQKLLTLYYERREHQKLKSR